MEKQFATPLVDELLNSLQGVKPPETDEFFYTRLRARMEQKANQPGWSFSVRPAWIIGALALLLLVNGWALSSKIGSTQSVKQAQPGVRDFAIAYDQTISTY